MIMYIMLRGVKPRVRAEDRENNGKEEKKED